MEHSKLDLPLKVGLFIVAFSWFTFTFYEFIINIVQGGGTFSPFWITLTDTASCVGLGFRTAAGFIAVTTILFYIIKRSLSKPEAIMSLRWILLLEAAYFAVTFFPSGMWGIIAPNTFGAPLLYLTIENTLPCMVESTLIPAALITLFFKLNPNKPAKNAVKWALIAGTVYILVFFLNNACNWIAEVLLQGTRYVTAYPLNIFSFALTTAGLFLLTIYAAYFTKRTLQKNADLPTGLSLSKAGTVITLLGLYYDAIYMLWIFFGSVGGWSGWYAWFLNHNVDLWVMMLPLVGLPLIFQKKLPGTPPVS